MQLLLSELGAGDHMTHVQAAVLGHVTRGGQGRVEGIQVGGGVWFVGGVRRRGQAILHV